MFASKLVSIGLGLVVLAGCATAPAEDPILEPEKPESTEPEVPLTSRAPTPVGPVETVPTDESDQIRRVLTLLETSYNKRARQRPVMRPFFARASGCAAGNLVVSKGIPLKYRWGVFSDPKTSHPIWVRFSEEGGLRGMAIKMLGIVGQKTIDDDEKKTQDFVFQSSPVFVARDVSGFLGLMSSGRAFRTREGQSASSLRSRYWTATPSKLGETAVKYQTVPSDCASGKPLPSGGNDELRKVLTKRRACFSFEVQEWKSEMETPIEDAAIAWMTPFSRVAWVVLEKASEKDFVRNSQACEKMSFSPWHAIIEQQPLGGIARLQKEAYALSARIRRKMNNWPEKEPE